MIDIIRTTVVAGALAVAGLGVVAPVAAQGPTLGEILFPTDFRDGVSAVQLAPGGRMDDGGYPRVGQSVLEIREAQAIVQGDPDLIAALDRRRIAINNVVAVHTALNGGRIVYHR